MLVYIICVCTVYIYYVYINTYTYSIHFENTYIYFHVYIYSYNLYIYIYSNVINRLTVLVVEYQRLNQTNLKCIRTLKPEELEFQRGNRMS